MKLAAVAEEISSSCLCRRVQALSRRVTGIYDEALRATGLTSNQLTTLVAIERSGEVTPGEIAALLGANKSTVSRTVARMERNGWLTSEPAGRMRRVTLTAAGRERIAAAHRSWCRAQTAAVGELGDDLARAVFSLDEVGL